MTTASWPERFKCPHRAATQSRAQHLRGQIKTQLLCQKGEGLLQGGQLAVFAAAARVVSRAFLVVHKGRRTEQFR